MAMAFKYSILFLVYGIMMLICIAKSNDDEYHPELSASEYSRTTGGKINFTKLFTDNDVTLYDFNSLGIGEPLRRIMHYAEINFHEEMISVDEWESKYKNLVPFRQLPVLEINIGGALLHLHQSIAICRLIAKLSDLAGDNSAWTILLIDLVVGDMENLVEDVKMFFFEKDKELKDKLEEELVEKKLPYFMDKFEAMARTNYGYFVQEKFTWAEIYAVTSIDFIEKVLKINLYHNNPSLIKLRQNFYEDPKIKNYMKERVTSNVIEDSMLFPPIDPVYIN